MWKSERLSNVISATFSEASLEKYKFPEYREDLLRKEMCLFCLYDRYCIIMNQFLIHIA